MELFIISIVGVKYEVEDGNSDGCADAEIPSGQQLLMMEKIREEIRRESEVAATCSRRVTMTNLFSGAAEPLFWSSSFLLFPLPIIIIKQNVGSRTMLVDLDLHQQDQQR